MDRNDRVMASAAVALLGLGIVVGLINLFDGSQTEMVITAARADFLPMPPANGPVPRAHTVTKITQTDGPVSIVRDPTDLPPAIGKRGPQRVRVDLETVEITGKLADGATYRYWTFNHKVPGPFVRVRVED